MLVTTAIALAIQFLPQILQGVGVISPNIAKLIADLGSAVPALITSLATGQSVPDETIVVLSALRSEVATLQADTNLSPDALQMCSDLLEAIDNGLAGYERASQVTDPSTLHELPTDL